MLTAIVNPYASVDWGSAARIQGFSHFHLNPLDTNQAWTIIYGEGIRHYAISHYDLSSDRGINQPPIDEDVKHGSRPVYPASDFPELGDVPVDALLAPNAEHFGHTDISYDWCSLGSTHSTPGHNPTGTGSLQTWRQNMDSIISALLYPDGGGVVIAHNDDGEFIAHALDHDPRVLGMEIWNDKRARRLDYAPGGGRYWSTWDAVLSTGRRCWGFGAVDGTSWRERTYAGSDIMPPGPSLGRNVLLVDSFTEQNALEAYRKGAFYVQLDDATETGLNILSYAYSDSVLSVETAGATQIRWYTKNGLVRTSDGPNDSYAVGLDDVFVRAEVDADGITDNSEGFDRIWLQPLFFVPTPVPLVRRSLMLLRKGVI